MSERSDTEIAAALRRMVGPVGEPVTMAVERGAIVRMALAVEDHDPIHFHDEAARARGYRGLVAPWPLLWLWFFDCTEYEHEFSFGRATVHGQDEYDLHEPMILGDRITVTTSITDAAIKHGKTGRLGTVVSERRFTNQRGELVAVLRTTLFRR